jgi:hypothetical protein
VRGEKMRKERREGGEGKGGKKYCNLLQRGLGYTNCSNKGKGERKEGNICVLN